MTTKTAAHARGRIFYDDQFGHVCKCTEIIEYGECEGHPAGPFDPMGETAYCNGTCNPTHASYRPTVAADPETATESGSYWYSCSRCGAGAWSGC